MFDQDENKKHFASNAPNITDTDDTEDNAKTLQDKVEDSLIKMEEEIRKDRMHDTDPSPVITSNVPEVSGDDDKEANIQRDLTERLVKVEDDMIEDEHRETHPPFITSSNAPNITDPDEDSGSHDKQ